MRDPRQSQFNEISENIKKKTELIDGGEIKSINNQENVFTASNVNLGWLQDRIMELIKKKEIKDKDDIKDFIGSSVQRWKKIYVHKHNKILKNGHYYKIEFSTKDDFGYYHYEFSTY